MINHNESDLHSPGIELGSPDSQLNALPIELTGRLLILDEVLAESYKRFAPVYESNIISIVLNNV
jgi:hypothetical protein